MILRLLLKRGLEEVIDENFVFVKYFQDLFIALPLPFNCDIWMRKKQPDFYIFLCEQRATLYLNFFIE